MFKVPTNLAKESLTRPIKVLSTVLITGAIALELTNLYAKTLNGAPLPGLDVVFWIGRLALVAHGIEGAIAAVLAPARSQKPLQYGIYTFFVGTVGLAELFQMPKSDP